MNRKVKLLAAALGTIALLASAAVAASAPAVSTGSATSISTTHAELRGTINPHGSKTSYQFQWGLTTAYGASSTVKSAGGGTTNVAVHTGIHGLMPGTTYHFRLIASNSVGQRFGSDRAFKTKGNPPPFA